MIEVVISVRAAGLNFADILSRQGLYPDSPPKPCVMGYEVSGVIEAVGEDVNSSFQGKSVAAMTRFGGQSDMVAVKATQIFDKPEKLTFEQAAAIPVNYLTAYALLVVMGSLHEGESVLIHNAGGGVGLAAIDIAKKIGAITYGTASPGKHKFLAERGLDHAIDYRKQDWLPVLKDMTNGRGVDLMIDPIGGAHWKKSYAALRAYRTAWHVWSFNCLRKRTRRQAEHVESGDSNAVVSSVCLAEQESRCVWIKPGPHVARAGESRGLDARHFAWR